MRINLFGERSCRMQSCRMQSWHPVEFVLVQQLLFNSAPTQKKIPKTKQNKQISSREAVLFPWFIALLFKAFSSWEVAACKVLNSVGVRHDTLSKTSTISHLNQADIFRPLKALKGTFSELQYIPLSRKWPHAFVTIPGN